MLDSKPTPQINFATACAANKVCQAIVFGVKKHCIISNEIRKAGGEETARPSRSADDEMKYAASVYCSLRYVLASNSKLNEDTTAKVIDIPNALSDEK